MNSVYISHHFSTGATRTGAAGTGTASTGAALALVLQAPLLETHCLWYHVISSVCYGISDLSNAHWALDIMVQLFACFGQKLAPAGKKIAPTGRHSRHVFATLTLITLCDCVHLTSLVLFRLHVCQQVETDFWHKAGRRQDTGDHGVSGYWQS